MSKTIIITGAGRGIGKACVEAFLDAGWRVGLIGRTPEPLHDLAQAHRNALALPCDVVDESQVEAAFDQAMQTWGRIDALFNNAGVGSFSGTADEISLEDWRRVIDINVMGSVICARAAFARMKAQQPQGGRIINNGSVSAHAPRPQSAPYTTSKHAITGLTKSLSLDGRPFDIACGQIDIGNALTEMAQQMTVGMPQADGAVRAEAVMDVTEVARSVLHMADMPPDANVQFMTVMATKMPFIGRG
jgi:NAD(P)-dependent dehydrogenase (short-subunit alcohol dehydrogenase family)